MIKVFALYYYPIKSCKGIALDQAKIDRSGILWDRKFMLVDPQRRFITQRDNPHLALIRPHREGEHLVISAPGMKPFVHQLNTTAVSITVEIWQDRCSAIDQGDIVAKWFSDFLGKSCRLVYFPENEIRRVDPAYKQYETDQINFSDGFPFLMISEASLSDLNQRLKVPVPVDRFRPNILVSGTSPYAEDNWKTIKIGEIKFKVVKPCARCVITTIEQDTARAEKEPLRTLTRYRKSADGKVLFGQNLVHDRTGFIRVGDQVEVQMD